VWIFLDGFYRSNRAAIAEFANTIDFQIVHVPLLHDRSTPRKFHWEPYNSALLLCDTPYFLRMGRFRTFHPDAVGDALAHLRAGRVVDFFQDECAADHRPQFGNIKWEIHDHPFTTCGMFGMDVESMVYELNGNDEVGLHQHHHEDGELTSRMEQLNRECALSKNGLVRHEHDKSPSLLLNMDDPAPESCGSPGCPRNAPRLAPERGRIIREHGHCRSVSYRGMIFWKCKCCGAFSPEDAVEYRDWPRKNRETRASMAVEGHGRNLPLWRDRLGRLHLLQSKVEMLQDSFGRR